MKSIIWLCLFLLSNCLLAQPPGMRSVNNGLFADDTEINIGDYFVFMYSAVNDDNDYGLNDFNGSDFPSINLMPDTTNINPYFKPVWRNVMMSINREYEGPDYMTYEVYSTRTKNSSNLCHAQGNFIT